MKEIETKKRLGRALSSEERRVVPAKKSPPSGPPGPPGPPGQPSPPGQPGQPGPN